MKDNAIVRICLYSLLILLLLGVLFVGMFGVRGRTKAPVETMIPVTAPTLAESFEATVVSKADVHNSPSERSESTASLYPGDRVTIASVQNCMGEEWGYIGDGWVQMKHFDSEQPKEAGGVREFRDDITAMEIEWPAGQIVIAAGDVDTIEVQAQDDAAEVSLTAGGCLKVEYFQGDWKLGFGSLKGKDLTITVPKNLKLRQLEVETASAQVEIRDLEGQIRGLDIDTASGSIYLKNLSVTDLDLNTASGECDLENLTVGELDADTASGDIRFSGSLDALEFDGASAQFTGILTNVPQRLEMETMSGKLDLTLPEDCGFTAVFEAASGHLSSDYATISTQSGQVYGDGACKIRVESMSGDLHIRKPAQKTQGG